MTGIFAQLSPGAPGSLEATEKRPAGEHMVDVPVLGSEHPTQRRSLRSVYADLWNGNRLGIRNRIRLLQLLLTIFALAFIRPQYHDAFQWITLFVLCHSFVFSFVLFWDRRCCGTVVQVFLPLLDWRRLELKYTSTVSLLLYGLFWVLLFCHKGYGGDETCNWMSLVFTLLTSLSYGSETWLQLRNAYDGRNGGGN